MTTDSTLTKQDLLAQLSTCCAPDCTRRSDAITALRIPLGTDQPAFIGIASFCWPDLEPIEQPSYAELVHAANNDTLMAPLLNTLLDYWPHPIPLRHES